MRQACAIGTLVACCVFTYATSGMAQADTAQEIVSRSDEVRNPAEPFRTDITLTEYAGGQERNQDVMAVFSKMDPATRQFRNLVQYLGPPRDVGKRVLLGEGALWFYDPTSKTSVRISPQQRLVGQAAIGDVLTANLAADYSATLVGTETIEDAEHKQRTCWHLDLKASDALATYSRAEYWVEQGSDEPIKAKLYSDSGRLLKIAYYRKFEQRLGRLRPGEVVIIDAVDTSLATIVAFHDGEFRDVPDLWYQRDYLPHLDIK